MSTTQLQEMPALTRLDAQMQQRVVEVASRLQEEDRQGVTEHHLADAAEEVGLEREYVRRALAQVRAETGVPPIQQTAAAVVWRTSSRETTEYRRVVTAMAAPFAVGTVAFLLKDFTTLAILLGLILPAPFACLSGFLAGRKRVGFVAAVLLIIALAPTLYHLGIHSWLTGHPEPESGFDGLRSARYNGQGFAATYLVLGMPFAGLLGTFGAWARRKYFPDPTQA